MLADVIGESWVPILEQEMSKEYMQKLGAWLSNARESNTIYPDSPDVFKALKLCPFGQIKAVILGQDPYHNGVADGLCFSYKDGIKQGTGSRQSLDVIIKEIEDDVYDGFNVNYDYDLSYLAKQGVLLLNSILTVYRGKPLSHANFGWEHLTQKILYEVILESQPKVFLLWGAEARKTFERAKAKTPSDLEFQFEWAMQKHLVLESVHPASDLYKKDSFGYTKPDYPNTFAGNKHFSQANTFLMKNLTEPINWFNIYEPYNNEDFASKFCPI